MVKITSTYDALFLFAALVTRILYYFSLTLFPHTLTRHNISLFVLGEGAFLVLLLSFVRLSELSDQRDILGILCGYNALKLLLTLSRRRCMLRQFLSALSFATAVAIAYLIDQETPDLAARASAWLQLLSWAAVDLA